MRAARAASEGLAAHSTDTGGNTHTPPSASSGKPQAILISPTLASPTEISKRGMTKDYVVFKEELICY